MASDAGVIGEEVEWSRGFPWMGSLFAAAAAVFVAAGVMHANWHLVIFSGLPLCLALALLLVRPRGGHYQIEEDALRNLEDDSRIEFDAIRHLTIGGYPRQPGDPKARGTLVLATAEESLSIPRTIRLTTPRLHAFLHDRIPPTSEDALPKELEPFYQQQCEEFGPDRVFTYVYRGRLPRGATNTLRAIWSGMLAVGIAWFALGFLGRDYRGWIAAGIVCSISALLLGLIQWAIARGQSRVVTNIERSALVIAPAGLALAQGDHRGKLRWEELLEVSPQNGATSFQLTRGPTGLRLRVAGAELIVADVFDRPLSIIHSQMLRYWRGPD